MAIVCLLVASTAAHAQDRVTYTPDGLTRPITALGEVLNSTGVRVTLQQPGGNTLTIRASQVVRIETAYDAEHLRGQELFISGQTQEARAAFEKALSRESREWVQREILADQCRCALRQNQLWPALQLFHRILDTDPSTPLWGKAPLMWFSAPLPTEARGELLLWLKSSRPELRLLACSWLLFDASSGSQARRTLFDLTRDSNPRISEYAKAQLWRVDLAEQKVTGVTLDLWRGDIERMIPEVRGGPQYLLSRGVGVVGDLRVAAAEALWVPYVYSHSEPLSSKCLWDAADDLERTGLTNEARVLYQELVVRYPDFPEAKLAQGKLPAR